MFNPSIKPSQEILTTAKQFGEHNGSGFDIEKPLYARVKAELDTFFIQVAGRFHSIQIHRDVLLDRAEDFKTQLQQKRNLRSEFPVSKRYFWFLSAAATLAILGEVGFIQATVGNGTDLDGFESYAISIAILTAMIPLKWFLGKWFLNKSQLASSEARYPKKSMIVFGVVISIFLLAMYLGIGLFRAEVLSWGMNDYAFSDFMADKTILAKFILTALTAGIFLGVTFLLGIIDALRNVLLVDKFIKRIQISQDYLTKQLQQISEEYHTLEGILADKENVKMNMFQSWLVEAHLAYMDGCRVYEQEKEKAQISAFQLAQSSENSAMNHQLTDYSSMSLSDIAELIMQDELNSKLKQNKAQQSISVGGTRFNPINYRNGFQAN